MNIGEDYDYLEDDEEGASYEESIDAADRACDADVRAYYEGLTPDVIGGGYFDRRMARTHEGGSIEQSRTFYTSPHRREISPAQLPLRHPLRALAWVLEQAPANSIVRIYAFRLTCPMAIDLLIRHGGDKTVKVILHPSGQTNLRLEEFFTDHGRIALRAFRDRLQVRIADLDGRATGTYASMHDNSVITFRHTTFGSYNMTPPARYQSWGSLYVADAEPSHAAHFDILWDSLARRTVQAVYPNLSPPSPPTHTALGRRGHEMGEGRSNTRPRFNA